MVLQQQIDALIDYLECHREMALGNISRGKAGREKSQKLWNELALILNTKGPKPAIKTGHEWRLYYNEYKYKCLKKVKTQKEEHNATGPAKKIILTSSQDRLYTILGRDGQEPLPVRQAVRRDVKASQDHLYTILGRNAQEPLPVGRDVKSSLDHLFTILGRDGQEPLPEGRDVKVCLDHLYTTLRGNKQEPLPDVMINPPFHEEALPASQCDEDIIEVSTPSLSPAAASPPPESTEERLVRLKLMKADAILAQARATERLADAIERGIERLRQPMVVVLQSTKKKRKRRRRSVETSDSESE